jgi:hypothetical protein
MNIEDRKNGVFFVIYITVLLGLIIDMLLSWPKELNALIT